MPRSDQGRPLPAQRQRAARAVLLHQLRGDITDDPSRRQPKCPVRRSRHQRWRRSLSSRASRRSRLSRPSAAVAQGNPSAPRIRTRASSRRVVDAPRHRSNRCRLRRVSRGREPMLPSPAALEKCHCRGSKQPAHDVGRRRAEDQFAPWSGASAWASFPRLLATVRSAPSPMAQRATTACGPITSAPRARAPSRRGTIVDRRKCSNSA